MGRGGAAASRKKWSSSSANRQQDQNMDITLQPFNANLMEPRSSGNLSRHRSTSANIAEPRSSGVARVSGKKVLTSNVNQEQDMDSNSPPLEVNSMEPRHSGNKSRHRSRSPNIAGATIQTQGMLSSVSCKKRRLAANVNQEQDIRTRRTIPEVNLVEPRLARDQSRSRSESVGTVGVTAQDNGDITRSKRGKARASYGKRSSKNTNHHLSSESLMQRPVVNRVEPHLSETHNRSMSENTDQAQGSQPTLTTYQHKKTRGPTFGVAIPKPGQKKVKVNVLMNTLVPFQAQAKIGPIIKQHYTKLITSWKKFEKKDVDNMWGEYLKYFCFSSHREEGRGRSVWEKIACTNYPKYLHNWKKEAVKLYGSVAAARNHKPGWTSLEVWQKLCDHWMSDAFLQASALRKANLASKKGIPHTSGNITYEERAIEQFNELGREPTQVEAYAYTHMTLKDDGSESWVSEEARQRSEDYQKRLHEKNGLPPDALVDQVKDPGLEIWQETVGGVNRGRLIGRPGERWSKRGVSKYYQAYVKSQESAEKWRKLEKDNKKKAKREVELYNFITHQNACIKELDQFVQALAQKCGLEAPRSMFLRPPPPPPPPFTSSRDDGSSLNPNDRSSTHLDEDEESDNNDESDEFDGSDGYDTDEEST